MVELAEVASAVVIHAGLILVAAPAAKVHRKLMAVVEARLVTQVMAARRGLLVQHLVRLALEVVEVAV